MRLAGAAEAALKQDRPPEVIEPILEKLAAMLTALREEAHVWLEEQPEQDANAETIVASGQLVGTDVDDLCALLESQNLAAVDKFALLSASLRQTLDAARFDRLRDAIDNLDFGVGAELLRGARLDGRSHAAAG
jgi:hypothetical protein